MTFSTERKAAKSILTNFVVYEYTTKICTHSTANKLKPRRRQTSRGTINFLGGSTGEFIFNFFLAVVLKR